MQNKTSEYIEEKMTENRLRPQISDKEKFDTELMKCKSVSAVSKFFKDIMAPTLQRLLEAEMDNHLGYSKKHASGNLSGNSRNGHYSKGIKTSNGSMRLNIPRDRKGEFEPVVVRKYETVESDVEERVISMYAKGMTTGDIKAHMYEIYGIETSKDMISGITDKVLPLVKEWQSRPLEALYPIVYLDAVHFKVRDNGRIVSKAAYIMLGITCEGEKEILGIWVGENEGSRFWMGLLNEIKNRGVNDILIACIDGLKGFPEAIKATFKDTEIQECIIHQIRNTTKYVSHKNKKSFCADLRKIYQAPDEETALAALEDMMEKWVQYAVYLQSWKNKWVNLSTFFVYAPEIRKIIYTTNAIEGLNRQFRKVTKTTTIFPHDESLMKLLWLAQNDITKKWTYPIRDWGVMAAQFKIMFPERMQIN